MEKLPEIGSIVKVTNVANTNGNFKDENLAKLFEREIINKKVEVITSGTSDNILLCYYKPACRYFAIPKEDVEEAFSMGKIYISGAISDIDYERAKDNFKRAEEFLNKAGYEAINPMTLVNEKAKQMMEAAKQSKEMLSLSEFKALDSEIHKEFMKVDIEALFTCDKIALIPGWEKSKGVRIELFLAKEYGYRIFTLPEMTEINIEND